MIFPILYASHHVQLTNSITPFSIYLVSIPTLSSSWQSFSNLSGVNLLRILWKQKHWTISIKFLKFWQIILNLTCFQRTFIQNKENCTNPPKQVHFFLLCLNLRWLPFSCQYYYHDCSKVKIKFCFSSWVNV